MVLAEVLGYVWVLKIFVGKRWEKRKKEKIKEKEEKEEK